MPAPQTGRFVDADGYTRLVKGIQIVDGAGVPAGTSSNPLVVAGGTGGGGGGAVSVADGSDVAEGTRTDTAYTSTDGSASGTVIALLKGLYVRLRGTLTTLPVNLTPTAGTNLSGTATTTSGGFNLPASANRRPGDVQGQNVGTVSIGFNEFGGTAVIGAAGTYTVPAGGTFAITTNQLVNFIAASGTAPVTITGL